MNVDANKNELKSSRMVSSCLQPPKTLWPAALRIQGQSLVFFKFHHWSQYILTMIRPLVFLFVGWVTEGFCLSSPSVLVKVRQVQTESDVTALADLRYNEWIANLGPDAPSVEAFRGATAELQAERAAGGAFSFIAWQDPHQVVLGAAELSPLEIDGALKIPADKMLYVTDVVTARQYRRNGVAAALMMAMEDEARIQQTSYLLLHVEEGNEAALCFYRTRMGYIDPTSDLLSRIDTELLHKNTNTWGQTVLAKKL